MFSRKQFYSSDVQFNLVWLCFSLFRSFYFILTFPFLNVSYFYCKFSFLLTLFLSFFCFISFHLTSPLPLSFSLSPSCSLVMSLSICQTVTLLRDNESSNQTSWWQLPPQCSTFPNKVTVCCAARFFFLCVYVCLCLYTSVFYYSFRVSVFGVM